MEKNIGLKYCVRGQCVFSAAGPTMYTVYRYLHDPKYHHFLTHFKDNYFFQMTNTYSTLEASVMVIHTIINNDTRYLQCISGSSITLLPGSSLLGAAGSPLFSPDTPFSRKAIIEFS